MATFGNLGTGSYGSTGQASDILLGSVFTSPADAGIVTSLSFYVTAGSTPHNYKGVLVKKSDYSIVAVGNVITSSSNYLQQLTSTFATPPTILPSTQYLLMVICGTAVMWDFVYDYAANTGYTDSSNSYTSPASPSDASVGAQKFAIYATYTPIVKNTSAFMKLLTR